jgi:hypothetical protein
MAEDLRLTSAGSACGRTKQSKPQRDNKSNPSLCRPLAYSTGAQGHKVRLQGRKGGREEGREGGREGERERGSGSVAIRSHDAPGLHCFKADKDVG